MRDHEKNEKGQSSGKVPLGDVMAAQQRGRKGGKGTGAVSKAARGADLAAGAGKQQAEQQRKPPPTPHQVWRAEQRSKQLVVEVQGADLPASLRFIARNLKKKDSLAGALAQLTRLLAQFRIEANQQGGSNRGHGRGRGRSAGGGVTAHSKQLTKTLVAAINTGSAAAQNQKGGRQRRLYSSLHALVAAAMRPTVLAMLGLIPMDGPQRREGHV